MERLQKIIASSGYTSRRKAEDLIKQGKVTVDGTLVTELGYKASDGAEIIVDGIKLNKEDKVYYLLNKPRGVVTTTSDEKGRKNVIDLINDNRRIYPVGRLDYDTTGALILTNDGDFANNLMHPKNEIDKVYIAKINGFLTPSDIMNLKNGVVIDGIKTSKAKIRVRKIDKETKTSIVELVIHEGRNHQVKNMFKALGYDVLKLKRERIAFLDVKNLSSGEYRVLNPKEIKQLYVLTQQKNTRKN